MRSASSTRQPTVFSSVAVPAGPAGRLFGAAGRFFLSAMVRLSDQDAEEEGASRRAPTGPSCSDASGLSKGVFQDLGGLLRLLLVELEEVAQGLGDRRKV